jgi:hypothetical protein
VDDDGDPLLLSVGGDPTCTEVVERQGTAWVTCNTPFTGRPDPSRLVGVHVLAVSAADPFATGPAQDTSLEVRNRPPRLTAQDVTMTMPCVPDRTACCFIDPTKGVCSEFDSLFLETSLTTAVVVDDDGDPLELSTAAAGGCLSAPAVPQPCAGATCDPVLTMCGIHYGCGTRVPLGVLSVSAGDGLAGVAGTLHVQGACPP